MHLKHNHILMHVTYMSLNNHILSEFIFNIHSLKGVKKTELNT